MKIIDAHVHFENISLIEETKTFFQSLGIEKLNLLSPPKLRGVNSNPQAICFKVKYPKDTYISGGLDYSDIEGKNEKEIEAIFMDQLLRLERIGFDGIKILETKPNDKIYLCARSIPFPIDSRNYFSFFERLEKNQMPIFWHVADPEEFWDKKKVIPFWAKERGWDYTSGDYPPKEEFYRRVGNVLQKFSRLKIVFAHFYFLSADLKRAANLLDNYPNINFDITPGTEMYYNFSKNIDKSRDFFIKYADRIIFGDDADILKEGIDKDEIITRINFMRDFLETDKEFEVFHGQGKIKGLKLPNEVLEKIYGQNFLRIVGEKPSQLNIHLAEEECFRIGKMQEEKYNFSKEDNWGYQAEEFLKNHEEV
jgi:predicted TIM-barrel fold metal-dependent hydrolase